MHVLLIACIEVVSFFSSDVWSLEHLQSSVLAHRRGSRAACQVLPCNASVVLLCCAKCSVICFTKQSVHEKRILAALMRLKETVHLLKIRIFI